MIRLPVFDQDASPRRAVRSGVETDKRIDRVFGSTGMRTIKSLLDPMGLTIERAPILYKHLSQRHLRVMFPVTGGGIRLGTVVSIVCLYDCVSEKTLYAHPMHAGPNVNPLLKHLDGPMASPKAQPGHDGDRATARMIAHKAALWRRYLRESEILGPREASARWRKNYYWALRRLYFCTRCTHCRWGTPSFDGPDPTLPPKEWTYAFSDQRLPLDQAHADAVAAVLSSEAWAIERSYAQRGGFDVSESPRLIQSLDRGYVQLVFPTNAALIQAGTLVGLSVIHSTLARETVFAHCLAAGPEPEIQFLLGDEVLGLPRPCTDASDSRARYVGWREEAWSQYWLDELDQGIAVASERWLRSYWAALEDLFSGNALAGIYAGHSPDGRTRHDQHEITLAAPKHRSAPSSSNGRIRRGITTSKQQSAGRPAVPFETLLNTGMTCFAGHASACGAPELRATEISTLMVNLGKRCNQTCNHCHVDAGPHRAEEMSRETVDLVLDVLRRHDIDTLDITGGAPELNPHFRHLASEASRLCRRVIDRCNLTILLEPGHEGLPEFLAKHRIEVIASLPSYDVEGVDRQRGRHVFSKSIDALRNLNALGYGRPGTGLILNLVYNPPDTELAPPQLQLEERFKSELERQFGIHFNRLYAMNNMPVNRFREHLERQGRLQAYVESLVSAFNPATVDGLMCRHSLSIGWDGSLYDCDFNHAANVPLFEGLPSHIRNFDEVALRTRPIRTAAHCFGCAAGNGSSCSGALANNINHDDLGHNGRCSGDMNSIMGEMHITR